MKRVALRGPGSVSCLVISLGCSQAASNAPMGGGVCVPGMTQICVGPGGCRGAQACSADGSGFRACDCGNGVAAANPGGMTPGGDSSTPESDAPMTSPGANDATESSSTDAANIGNSPADAANRALDVSGADSNDCGQCRNPCDGQVCNMESSTTMSPSCLTWALGGIGMPPQTVAGATSTYNQYVASLAIDGSLTTAWWAAGYTASITITFPTSTTFKGIRLAAAATPLTSESYTIFGSDSTTVIGSANANPTNGQPPTYSVLPAIPIIPGAYSSITISVNGMASWVQISEISLLTTECP